MRFIGVIMILLSVWGVYEKNAVDMETWPPLNHGCVNRINFEMETDDYLSSHNMYDDDDNIA